MTCSSRRRPTAASRTARAASVAHAQGRYAFRSILAEPYPIPHDGPVGALLSALGRHPWRPAHLHFMIQAPGCETLITRCSATAIPIWNPTRCSACVLRWSPTGSGIPRPGAGRLAPDAPYYTLDYDFVLNPKRPSA